MSIAPIYGGNVEIELLALVVDSFGDGFNAKMPELPPACVLPLAGRRRPW
jgi:hypothetical protein